MKWFRFAPDKLDLPVIAVLYIAAVGVFRIAFQVFTAERPIALFVVFAVAGLLVLGVVAPVVYTVWVRKRPLDSIGVGKHRWKSSLILGFVLGGIQYAFTFAGYTFPGASVWAPLLVMALTVGVFESIFFRGFIQNLLEDSFGIIPSILIAAGLYSLYHFGYMMSGNEMLFLFGLGIAFAAVFRLTRNILILWPFITPVGSFFNNLTAGDIELPMISMLGFGEVLVAMGVFLFIVYRRQRKSSS
jgi:membrane protease YdiL (CAAX protease family)